MSNVQKKGASGFIFLLLTSSSYHLTTPHLLPYDKLQIREQNEKGEEREGRRRKGKAEIPQRILDGEKEA